MIHTLARTAARANCHRARWVLAGTVFALIAAALMAIVLLADTALPWGAATTPAGVLDLGGRVLIRAALVGIMALCLQWWRRRLWADSAGLPASGEQRHEAVSLLAGHLCAPGRPGVRSGAAQEKDEKGVSHDTL